MLNIPAQRKFAAAGVGYFERKILKLILCRASFESDTEIHHRGLDWAVLHQSQLPPIKQLESFTFLG